jgi:hypothetical protein
MGEEVQTLREGVFMLRYMYNACLMKTDNRNTEQNLSTSASSQFMSSHTECPTSYRTRHFFDNFTTN